MAETAPNLPLPAALAALAEHGVLPGALAPLEAAREATAAALRQAVLEAVPAWTASANPEILPGLDAHIGEHLDEVIRLFRGRRADGFGFVARFAAAHATHRFPLEALLHTYRCVHRAVSTWVRDAALASADESAHVRRVVAAAADFAIEYADAVSTAATSSYVDETRRLAEAEGDRRTELLNLLLTGYDEADSRAAQLLRRAGYLEQRQSYCVVAARSVDPGEMKNAARAGRMADALGDVLRTTSLRYLVGVREGLVLAVVSGTRRISGWTAPQSLLADRLHAPLRKVGPAALIGVSNDVPSTAHVPRAVAEAKTALDLASVADRVRHYGALSLRRLLVAHGGEALAATLPPWVERFLAADDRAKGRLRDTVAAYADADMNVLRAARQLNVHPNTIYARAEKLEQATGKNLMRWHDLTELLLASELRPVQRAVDH